MINSVQQATSVVCQKKISILKYAVPIIVVTLLFARLCPAQIQFARTYGGVSRDWSNSVIQTTDGGYVIAGYTESFGAGSEDLLLIKLNYFGSVQWAKAVGGIYSDYGYSVIQTTDGGYAMTGYSFSFSTGDRVLFLVKLSSSGSLDWAKAVGGRHNDYGYSIIQTSDSGYIIAGCANGCALFLVKFSYTGSMQWAKAVGGTDYDISYSVVQTTDGGFAAAGYTNSYGAGSRDLFLLKFKF